MTPEQAARLVAGLPVPVRAVLTARHQCRCQLVPPAEYEDEEPGPADRCTSVVETPDQPFCDSCMQAGHHLLPQWKGV